MPDDIGRAGAERHLERATADWNTLRQLTPTAVLTSTATFSSTGTTSVQNVGAVTIGAIGFTAVPNAQAYSFTIGDPFTINGAGVTNASTNTQGFEILDTVTLAFQNGATANNGTGQVRPHGRRRRHRELRQHEHRRQRRHELHQQRPHHLRQHLERRQRDLHQ